ncbi:NOG [Branchiostoma lanceolatum]|uniref:NOG protein n=1 Tax=Branchiostoma lanceolatum TaxID=7740 RepID=A0A8S4MP83_BRALA|nr:NOG [Branchiostoma lanceolatum]
MDAWVRVFLLAGSFLICSPAAFGQPFLHLRPRPSDDLPVLDLIEPPNSEFDPKEADLDVQILRKLLGRQYDPYYMSIEHPDPSTLNANCTLNGESNEGNRCKPPGPKPRWIDDLDVGTFPNGRKVKLNKRSRRKFKMWMWSLTHCPVVHSWKDLGVRFWPRWVKEGRCSTGRSCSFPPGMTCRPSRSVMKTFLRFHCQGWGKQHNCNWIKIHYPLIAECSCSC